MFFKRKDRFSIRKLSVGVCSVSLGALFITNVDTAMAEQLDNVEQAATVAEVNTPVDESDSVANEVVENEVEQPVMDSSDEVESTEVTEEDTLVSEDNKDIDDSAIEVEETVAPKRVAGITYKVSYTDVDTNEVVYARSHSTAVETSLPKSESASAIVTEKNELDINPALASWELSTNQSPVVEKTVSERGGKNNVINFDVVKKADVVDEEIASYTGFRADAGEESSTSSLLKDAEKIQENNQPKITDDYSVSDPKSLKYVDPVAGRYSYAYTGYKNNPDVKYVLSIDTEAPKTGDKAPVIYVTPVDANGKPLAEAFVADISKPGSSNPFSTIDKANPTITVDSAGQITISPMRSGVNNENKHGIEDNLLAANRKSTVYLDELVVGSPSYAEQITKYVEYKTNKPLLPDYTQSGWNGFNYTTEPFDIPEYKLVSENENKNGMVTETPTILAGDTTYTRLVAPLAKGPMTIYRKVVFDNNTGHGTMTIYVSPKNANNPEDEATLPTAEEFFTNIEKYKTFEHKYYLPEADIDNAASLYNAGVNQLAVEKFKADSSKSLEDYKKEIIANDFATTISADREAFFHAPIAEKTLSDFKAEGNTDYKYISTVNSRPFESVGDSNNRTPFYEPLINARGTVTGIATIRNGWKQSDTVIYEYAKIEKVEAEYFVEGTNTHLYPDPADYDKENPTKKEVAKDIDGQPYADTNIPPTLKDKDGIVYELVVNKEGKPVLKDGSAPVSDKIAYGGGQVIQYQYAAKKGGEVVAQHFIEGTTTRLYPEDKTDKRDTVVKAQNTPVGTKYENTPPATLKDKDGVVYALVTKPDGTPKVKAGSAEATGTVTEEKQIIQYEYAVQKGGQVTVEYVDTEGNPIHTSAEVKPKDTPIGTSYDSEPQRENTIKDPETGKTYKLVTKEGNYPVGDVAKDGHLTTSTLDKHGVDDPTGQVGKEPKVITYVYEEVKGDVVVLYRENGTGKAITGIGSNGKTIGNVATADTQDKEDDTARPEWEGAVIDTQATSTGSAYTTTDNRPETITTEDGKIYKRVEKVAGAEDGKVVEGTTRIVYYYELQKGNVDVTYVDTDGNPIAPAKEVAKDADTGTDYDTKTAELKPPTITTEDGKTYELVPAGEYGVGGVDENGHLISSAPVDGKVKDQDQTITYVYKEVKGDVVVHYVDESGNPIAEDVTDTPESSTGTSYDTTDNKPKTITTKDGKTYELIPNMTKGEENGTVVPGTTEVTYVYKEVKGDVIVHY
ncbi:MucBP domain-containing protein, partial [Aerococcaceae bacterium zg-B36]|uniref:MucBP domain-containing protein n=1 Tax=Aerococcaceae bacterium zg-252 TaxID=2796928 RepID=UPI001BD90E07|nr:MucBP domain-containing protein [Aerococcaceae bacterium zg-B36]